MLHSKIETEAHLKHQVALNVYDSDSHNLSSCSNPSLGCVKCELSTIENEEFVNVHHVL